MVKSLSMHIVVKKPLAAINKDNSFLCGIGGICVPLGKVVICGVNLTV